MVYLEKNATSQVIMTLYEKLDFSVAPPFYMIEFVNKQSNMATRVAVSDVSAYDTRFQDFRIVDTTDPNPLASEVDLIAGDYHYKAYQMTENSIEDANIVKLLEIGFARMTDTTTTTEYTPPQQGVIYNG